jgi:CubicO group peptidase (beta-lactamase class C family)
MRGRFSVSMAGRAGRNRARLTYSNTNFILLGMVIRRVAREPIGALLRSGSSLH